MDRESPRGAQSGAPKHRRAIMAFTVNTNLASINSISRLNETNQNLSKTLGRISSGLRINSAADDAAGLSLAENLSAQQRSVVVAMRNTSDGISLLQTAESASSEISNVLKRMRELAVQSSNGTLTSVERSYLQDENDALALEIERIADSTNFNGLTLLNGTSFDIQVGIFGAAATNQITVTLSDLQASPLGVNSLDISSASNAQNVISVIDGALASVNTARSQMGSGINRLESAFRQLDSYNQNLTAAESGIRDADFAYESAQLTKYQVMQQAGVAVLAQAKNMNASAAALIG